jgi:hypothetical protein
VSLAVPREIGVLNCGDLVTVNGRRGGGVSPHEPQWVEHRTLAFKKVLQGADIHFDGDSHAINMAEIELVIPNSTMVKIYSSTLIGRSTLSIA